MERVGEYEIVSVVGSGSFGKAVLVRDKTGRKLIMKLINTRQMNKEDIEEAKREIQVLSKLVDAPFIVHYRNAFNDTYHGYPHLCIVMDFCEGGDMAKLIRERKRQRKYFSEVTLRTWLLQLAIALDYMHKHKILHRDLKPANVFLDESNYIRVGDLGLSKILEFTLQQAKTQCGTPAFMAPELCKGKPYSSAADIWALGCIMIEAATFELPFRGLSFPELNRNICNAPAPKIPDRYSVELRTICDKMLNKDPAMRPSAREILESPCLKNDYLAYKQKNPGA
ncbi:CMGC kinase, CK2 family, putative [Eimeria brunetti]|uniref:non-specific serine/threonine protein kinase n=1 Tax=Eimeria brunetti TaxID=51314 RepID=U6LIP4_9EIME|nr:CMGC kinase, CK2 family, putative [Eimeria brunetti]